jgi:hypothetical protein
MSWSDTLRLELQPFNISVISLVTGSVATNVMSHADLTLPDKSLYQKALPEIQARGLGKDVQSKSAPADFAREVVKDVLGGAMGPPVWRGTMASMVKFMLMFMPTFLVVSVPSSFCSGELVTDSYFVGPGDEQWDWTGSAALKELCKNRIDD